MRLHLVRSAFACVGAALALATASVVFAQNSYDQIQVGTVLRGGIGLGVFQKPLPLPDGEWLVVANRPDVLPLARGVDATSTPLITLTLKSLTPENPIFSFVVSFTPDTTPVEWQNNKCESADSSVLVDDLGTTPGSFTFLCVQARAVNRFKNIVAAAPGNSNAWIKNNLSSLSQYSQEIPDDTLWVAVYGSRHRGRSVSYTFFLKRESDIQSNASYAKFVKDWMNPTGKELGQFLESKDASIKSIRNFSGETSRPLMAVELTPAVPSAPLGQVMAPVWQMGDEWRYAYKSPSDSGTFVWSVQRIESVDDVPHYVIRSGTREIFYRVSDLAFSFERVDGVVVDRAKPSRLSYVWPLAVGKTWEQSYVREQPVDRQTTNRDSLYTVDAEETITVPAGTFRTLKIIWRNKNTGALNNEVWYAPDVKLWVKMREVLSNGIRERELLAFKRKQPP